MEEHEALWQLPVWLVLSGSVAFLFWLLCEVLACVKRNVSLLLEPFPFLFALALLLLLFSGFTIERLFQITDSFEYLYGAVKLSSGAPYGFELEDSLRPFRYPPWFSLLALGAPVYFLGSFQGALVFSTLIIYCIFLLALLPLTPASLLSVAVVAFLLLWLPEAAAFLPGTATEGLVTLLLLLALRLLWDTSEVLKASAPLFSLPRFALMQALIVLFKPVLFWALPMVALLRLRSIKAPIFLSSLIGTFMGVGCHALYNATVFHSPWFSGYHYWLPNPHFWLTETFNIRFLFPNLTVLLSSSLIQLSLLGVLLCLVLIYQRVRESGRKHPHVSDNDMQFLLILSVMFLCALLLFALYYYPTVRLALPVALVFLVFLVHIVVRSSERRMLNVTAALAVLLLVPLSVFVKPAAHTQLPLELSPLLASEEDFVLFSNEHPLGLRMLLREFTGTDTAAARSRFMPLSREAEYASKLILSGAGTSARGSIDAPRDPLAHRHESVRALNATEAMSAVLVENGSLNISSLRIEERAVYLWVGTEGLSPQLMEIFSVNGITVLPSMLPGLMRIRIENNVP